MVAGGVEDASAGGNAAGSGVGKGEVCGGYTDAGKEIESKPLVDPGLEERVEVSKEGTVGLAIVGVAQGLVPPGNFRVKTQVVLESDVVGADAEEGATLFRGRVEAHGVVVRRRGHEGATADQDIPLLGRGEAGEQNNRTGGCERREFFQYSPLVNSCGLLEHTHKIGGTPVKQPRAAGARESSRLLELTNSR